MLRVVEVPVTALGSPFKVGSPFKAALGASAHYAYEQEVSEERSSDEHFDIQCQPSKLANAGSRSLGVTSSACRGPSRTSVTACASWVPSFLGATYFQPCERHRHHKKNECTFFCITCGVKPLSVCQHCMGAHAGHQVIQVRRYVYCDVVRACDINAYVDTTGVQNYIINSAKVMFLNHRPHSKIGRANGVDICRTCHRHLREGFSYCSLSCKVEALTKGEAPAPAGCPGSAPAPAPAPPSPVLAGPRRVGGGGAPSPSFCLETCNRRSSTLLGPLTAAVAAASKPPLSLLSPPTPRTGPFGTGARSPAAAAAAASLAARSCGAGLSSDPESSEAGEDTVLFGSSRHAVHGASSAEGAGSRRRTASAREREQRDSYGSASSEDDCCEFNFENPPKRRRSSLITRRPSNGSSALEGLLTARSTAAADAAAAVAAAATLLMPFRNAAASSLASSLVHTLANSLTSSHAPSPTRSLSASLEQSSDEPHQAASAAAAANSRRKQHAPVRAPSC